jgi:hypothetical protein
VAEINLVYYQQLIQNGLITDEIAYQDLTITSTVLRAAGDALEGVAGGNANAPNTFTGGTGFGGSPYFTCRSHLDSPWQKYSALPRA